MDEVFSRYLDPAFRYVRFQSPARVRSRDDALRDGLNCVVLAHLVIRGLFGYALPTRLQALELVRDLAHFEPVPARGRRRAGDLVWFGVDRPRVEPGEFVPQYDGDELANGGDFPVKQVAVCADNRDDGDHLLLHASSADGNTILWPLRKFAGYDRYRRIYAVRRLRREFRRPTGASGGTL
ncbi:MAG: hypothetical protein J2P28_18370 [Actinobacteria bacterium]|nr:hypothetical protein [Actinomycetota bacterium]